MTAAMSVITPSIENAVTELYLGYFGRLPDTAGMVYWSNQIASGASVSSVAQAFAQSAEFTAQYAGLSHAQEVTQIYEHVLDRAPDAGGLSYWTGVLDNGTSISSVVWSIVNTAFNEVGTQDGLLVQNQVATAQSQMAPIVTNQASVTWTAAAGFGQADVAPAFTAVLDAPLVSTTPVATTVLAQWDLGAMHFQSAWSAGYTGKGVVIAQIDTGIDLSNAALTQNLSAYNWNFINNSANVQDDNGHGTAVASELIAASVAGNAPSILGGAYGAQLMVLKALDANGNATDANIISAINYAVAHGANVINLSLGSNAPDSAELSAIANAVSQGVIVCMASGNTGASNPQYPAAYASGLSSAIAVGASAQTSTGADALASFSNGAGSLTAYNFVDAPGNNILAYGLNGVLQTWSGSSFATPLISAEAADLLSAHSGLSGAQIVQAIVHDTTALVGVQAATA
jgi:subtilisin family serine protease